MKLPKRYRAKAQIITDLKYDFVVDEEKIEEMKQDLLKRGFDTDKRGDTWNHTLWLWVKYCVDGGNFEDLTGDYSGWEWGDVVEIDEVGNEIE